MAPRSAHALRRPLTALTLGSLGALLITAAGCSSSNQQVDDGGFGVQAMPPPIPPPPPDPPAPAPAPPERVVVAVVVDQLAAWLLKERIDLLPDTGGFKRLRKEGTYVPTMRFTHGYCATAVGHASLFTGATPRQSGITHNGRWSRETGTYNSIVSDDNAKLVTNDGAQAEDSSSLARLEVPTVADQLRAAHDDAVIISLSMKDRASVFGGGRAPTLSLWLDTKAQGFVTSTAFAEELPDWVKTFNDQALPPFTQKVWNAHDPRWLKEHAGGPDDAPGEGDFKGLGTSFPHDLSKTSSPYSAFKVTPEGDEALLALAVQSLESVEVPSGAPLLLAISLSSTDYIGHIFGPHSREAYDNLLRLDRALGDFFAKLDERFGPDGYGVLLTGDHGIGALPEVMATTSVPAVCGDKPCPKSYRFVPEEEQKKLEAVAGRAIGVGPWIDALDDPYVFLSSKAFDLREDRKKRLRDAIVAELTRHPAVASVFDTDSFESCPPVSDDSVEARICRSIRPGRSGDFYVLTKPGSFWDVGYTLNEGVNHGTPYPYDCDVPLFVRAPGLVPAGATIDEKIDSRSFSLITSQLFDVEPPDAAKGGRTLLSQ